MLQQTQVTTVIPYYDRFLARFPTVDTLANAKEDDVLSLWSGLGYYSRAKNLQKGAKHLLKEHRGTFPRDRETLLKTPGIGPYTAGAILSIAFNLREAIVDGNVQRVFSRFYAWQKPLESSESQNFFWSKAREWVAGCDDPKAINQGLMELGSLVCIKGKPRCESCPISKGCLAHRRGIAETLPVRKPKRQKVDLYWLSVRYQRGAEVYLLRNGEGDWWENLWDLPRHVFEKPGPLNEKVEDLLNDPLRAARRLGIKRHAVTHHRLHVTGISIALPRKKDLPAAVRNGKWFACSEVATLPLSSLARKVLVLE